MEQYEKSGPKQERSEVKKDANNISRLEELILKQGEQIKQLDKLNNKKSMIFSELKPSFNLDQTKNKIDNPIATGNGQNQVGAIPNRAITANHLTAPSSSVVACTMVELICDIRNSAAKPNNTI